MESVQEFPGVVVIVPVYNEEKNIGACLGSIKSQTYPQERVEVIVVDDGSTDLSADIACAYGATVIRQGRRGPAAARNRGVREASHDLVAFLDADDTAEIYWLEESVGCLKDRRLAAAGCTHGLANKETVLARLIWLEQSFRDSRLPGETDHFGASGSIWEKKEFLDLGGFETSLICAEDMALAGKASRAGKKLGFIQKNLIRVRHPEYLKSFFFNQAEKVAYMVLLYYLFLFRNGGYKSSYSGAADYLQTLLLPAFLGSLIFLHGFALKVTLAFLLLLLIVVNGPYMLYILRNRGCEKSTLFQLALVPFYLVFRDCSWCTGLIWGVGLVFKQAGQPGEKQ